MAKPEIVYIGLFDMQVCVPKEFSDEEVLDFANTEHICGTTKGWTIRRQGSKRLSGTDERVECARSPENCHIMLDA